MTVARLLFEYEGATVRLVARYLVDLVVRGTPVIDRPGTYVDLRSADDSLLARVPASAAFATSREVFPEPPNTEIVRVNAPSAGTFFVTIPVGVDVDHITLVRRETDGTVRDVMRFPWATP